MRPFQRIAVEDISQVGEARRAGQALALELRFGEEAGGRLAVAVTELGTNLVRHAGGGALLLGVVEGGIEVLSLDRGPGMDIERCLRDGYSTAGTAGNGLGAVRRLARHFAAFSQPGGGTVLRARFEHEAGAPPAVLPGFSIAGLGLASPGERVCGDGWGLRTHEGRTLLLMADGLGHGPEAAEAADLALDLFQRARAAAPALMLEDSHASMRSTRGAAVAIASLGDSGPVVFAGVGNIVGRLISGVSDKTLLSQPGTLGVQIRRLQDCVYDWPEHALLVMHSDGIATRWSLAEVPGLLQCEPMLIAAWILRDHSRGRDDATIVVVRRH
ncbi:ATP-binding protein [Roseateles sp. DC23W]|uniref:ATP-binding protein n=1 Tax=Pelomonas dachongensis TaxID=3299029 RepID=A0ABW7EK42_9BURK